jgi:4-amino-4-deoxy-L-arabinose transferase-like glycosyltransferase
MMVLGYSEALIRLFNIACGLATVLLLFRFLEDQCLSPAAAAAGAGCYAATPIAIYFDRALMMDTFVVMMGALYLVALRRWIAGGSRTTLAIATVALAIAVTQKLPTAWPAGLFGAGLVLPRQGWRGWLRPGFLFCHGITVACMAAWTGSVWLSGYGLLSLRSHNWEWYFGWSKLLSWVPTLGFLARMANGFSITWAVLAIVGGWLAWRKQHRELILLAVCGLSAYFLFPNLNLVHTHYQLPILFAVAPLAGLGLAGVAGLVRGWQVPAVVFSLAGATAWGFEVARWSHFPMETRHLEGARELASLPNFGPRMYYVEGGYVPTLHYLARRRGPILQDGDLPDADRWNGYDELLIYSRGMHPPAPIARHMRRFRPEARHDHWHVYRRIR